MCMANQRQVAIAWNSYALDYNDWHPTCNMSPNRPMPWDYRVWYYFTRRDNYSMSNPLFTCPLARIANYQTYAGWTWAGDPHGNPKDQRVIHENVYPVPTIQADAIENVLCVSNLPPAPNSLRTCR